jgi:hypothetical protein
MLVEIDRFIHWVRLRSPAARTWRDYGYDLRLFASVVGDLPLDTLTFVKHGTECHQIAGLKSPLFNGQDVRCDLLG